MSEGTRIPWAHNTFNPWWGCVKIAPECQRCYAATFSHRLGHDLWGPNSARRMSSESYWQLPLKWNTDAARAGERRRVFCASMADWLEARPDLIAPRLRLFDLIRRTESLDWLLLSKRVGDWQALVAQAMQAVPGACDAYDDTLIWLSDWLCGKPPKNVWVGTTIGHPDRLDQITALRAVPAVVHFISIEPLISELSFISDTEIGVLNALAGLAPGEVSEVGSPRIAWAILGGESGAGARPMHLDWMRSLMAECRDAGTAVFVKQLGANVYTLPEGSGGDDGVTQRVRLIDRSGSDMAEWPPDLRVREFPQPSTS